jgi:hypothetical protein
MAQFTCSRWSQFVKYRRYQWKHGEAGARTTGSHGSAVAHANVLTAIRRSYGRTRNCRSETVEPIDTKFFTIDYVAKISTCANFGCYRLYGGVPAYAWNITFAYLFYFFLIYRSSEARTARTERRRKTHNGSGDVDLRKDVPFWGFIIIAPPMEY